MFQRYLVQFHHRGSKVHISRKRRTKLDKFSLYYDFAKMRYLQTFQQNRDFDIKASGMLALAVTLVGIAAVVIKDIPMNLKDEIVCEVLIATIILLAAFITTVVCSFKALALREWEVPDTADLAKELNSFNDQEDAMQWTADGLQDADAHNMKVVARKGEWLNSGLIGLVILVFPIGFLAVRIYLS